MTPPYDAARRAEHAADLDGMTPDELKREAKRHVDETVRELAAAKKALREGLHPVKFAKRHPRAAAVMGGGLAVFLLSRLLRRRKPGAGKGDDNPGESLGHAFGRNLLGSVGKTAGRALPALFLWGLARHGRGRSPFGPGRRGTE